MSLKSNQDRKLSIECLFYLSIITSREKNSNHHLYLIWRRNRETLHTNCLSVSISTYINAERERLEHQKHDHQPEHITAISQTIFHPALISVPFFLRVCFFVIDAAGAAAAVPRSSRLLLPIESQQCDQMARLVFQFLAICSNETLLNSITFCQILNRPSKHSLNT